MYKTTTQNPFTTPANPFMTPAKNPFDALVADKAHEAVAADAPEGSYEYRLVKREAETASEELEASRVAVEVRVSWGKSVLKVAHLRAGRAFYLGETMADVLLPADKLCGASRVALVTVKGGAPRAVVLPGTRGTVALPGQAEMTVEQAIESGRAVSSSELAGAYEVPLALGCRLSLELDDLAFELAAVKEGKKARGGLFAALGAASFLCIAGSAIAHGAVVGAMAAVMPDTASLDDREVTEDQRILMKQYLESAAEQEVAAAESPKMTDAVSTEEGGQSGTAAKGSAGQMGSPSAAVTNGRMGIKGPADNEDPRVARARAIKEAEEFGMIGLINAGEQGGLGPTADWGADSERGRDERSAQGALWGDDIRDTAGWGGLSLTGTGEGGDGDGEGIGLDHVGTIGGGFGNVPGQGFCRGYRCGGGTFTGPGHTSRAPNVRTPPAIIKGGLPAEVIQRTVRQNFGRFRMCYEAGLRNNPSLQGRVAVSFVIDSSGRVASASASGDMPDANVASCVARQFYGLSFPSSDAASTVSYPIVFTPNR